MSGLTLNLPLFQCPKNYFFQTVYHYITFYNNIHIFFFKTDQSQTDQSQNRPILNIPIPKQTNPKQTKVTRLVIIHSLSQTRSISYTEAQISITDIHIAPIIAISGK